MSDATPKENNNSVNMSDLDSPLPAAAAALSAEDRAGLLNEIKDKLDYLTGKHSLILESLSPKVRKRVESLIGIQNQHDDLEAKYFEEKADLEAKYQRLYEPLYTKRYEIVSGVVEVEEVAKGAVEDREKETDVKGVPDFWLTALKTNEYLSGEITERDEGALKYLTDIKCYRLEDSKGFKLEFYFDPNPYFKNSVLTKAYHMIDEEEGVLEKAIGTDIEWYPGKNLTQKILKKKPKKGSKDTKPITKTVDCHSIFNFFKPPKVPEGDDDEIDEDADEELQHLYIQDYDIGYTIKEKIIPRAVYWFTGEAVEDEDDEDEDEDGKDEEANGGDDKSAGNKRENELLNCVLLSINLLASFIFPFTIMEIFG